MLNWSWASIISRRSANQTPEDDLASFAMYRRTSASAVFSNILALCLATTMTCCCGLDQPQTRQGSVERRPLVVVAHRGSTEAFPENSLGAISHALSRGASWIEIDVRATVDDTFVLFHDSSLDRMLGVSGEISSETWNSLIRHQLRHRGEASGQRVPLALPAIEMIQGGATALVELKGEFRQDALIRFLGSLANTSAPERIVIASRTDQQIELVRQYAPLVRTGVFFSAPMIKSLFSTSPTPIDVVLMHWSICTEGAVARAHERGQRVIVTTVGQKDLKSRAIELGADGYFVNW